MNGKRFELCVLEAVMTVEFVSLILCKVDIKRGWGFDAIKQLCLN